jgi:hypothetical protein
MLVIALLASQVDAAGQATTTQCAGVDCVVRTITPQCRAFASFEACTRGRFGRTACDGDAGVLRLCQLDGGWEAVGSSSSGSGDGFWADAGAGYIFARESVKNPDGGRALLLYGDTPPAFPQVKAHELLWLAAIDQTFGGSWAGITFANALSPGSANIHGRIQGAAASSTVAGSVHAAGLTYSSADQWWTLADNTTRVMRLNSAGLKIDQGSLEFTHTTVPMLDETGDSRFELRNTGLTAATASSTTPAFALRTVNALDTGDQMFVVCHGGLCTYDFAIPYGAPAQALNGIRIGDPSASSVTAVSRGTVTNPAACGANTTTDNAVTMGVAVTSGSECFAGVPATALQAGLSMTCANIDTGVVLRCANNTGGSLTPPAGTYSCLCFLH